MERAAEAARDRAIDLTARALEASGAASRNGDTKEIVLQLV